MKKRNPLKKLTKWLLLKKNKESPCTRLEKKKKRLTPKINTRKEIQSKHASTAAPDAQQEARMSCLQTKVSQVQKKRKQQTFCIGLYFKAIQSRKSSQRWKRLGFWSLSPHIACHLNYRSSRQTGHCQVNILHSRQYKMPLECQLDAGASCNMISYQNLSIILQNRSPPLNQRSAKLRLFNGSVHSGRNMSNCRIWKENGTL